jgi:hypothetical protein
MKDIKKALMKGARVFVVVEFGNDTTFYKASLSGEDLNLSYLKMEEDEVIREVKSHIHNRRET